MAGHIIFQCPACQARQVTSPQPADAAVGCSACQWTRDEGVADYSEGYLCRCRICGCQDLWRQKDFPPALGLVIVGTAATISCVAWAYYRPILAIGSLMAAALVDMVLYTFMGDMLVCYRCAARHRKSGIDERHFRYDLETAERYRQEDLRKRQAGI